MLVVEHLSKRDLLSAWKQAKRRLDGMSTQERIQTLVQAGILTSKGNLCKPYKDLSLAGRLKSGGGTSR